MREKRKEFLREEDDSRALLRFNEIVKGMVNEEVCFFAAR